MRNSNICIFVHFKVQIWPFLYTILDKNQPENALKLKIFKKVSSVTR